MDTSKNTVEIYILVFDSTDENNEVLKKYIEL